MRIHIKNAVSDDDYDVVLLAQLAHICNKKISYADMKEKIQHEYSEALDNGARDFYISIDKNSDIVSIKFSDWYKRAQEKYEEVYIEYDNIHSNTYYFDQLKRLSDDAFADKRYKLSTKLLELTKEVY